MKVHWNWILLTALLILAACETHEKDQTSLSKLVNPFIGTDGPGNTYPGATLP